MNKVLVKIAASTSNGRSAISQTLYDVLTRHGIKVTNLDDDEGCAFPEECLDALADKIEVVIETVRVIKSGF